LGGRAWYRSRYLGPGRWELREERLPVPGLPRALHGFRILHLSDMHAGPFLGAGDLKAIAQWIAGQMPDLLVLTGDYITHAWDDVLAIAPDLGALVPPRGGFAVFGNHDYRGHQEARIAAALREQNITCLENKSVRLGELPLWVTGISDLEESPPEAATPCRPELEAGEFELVLCHHPLGAPALVRPGCVAVLAGHTHGRQIDLPGLRALGPSHPGLRVNLGPTTLYVNRGLGVVGVPVRVGVPAEVVCLELVPASPSDSRPTSRMSRPRGPT